ncbi:PREDICTED: uncharacterized protein LOC105362456 [Ceratosolen solmsi marchali]|uniref:Uncharacterized protein LOC105362456 n=1 Tax=Ceratosolen solmsi marchali TaxID=326594 RepID=A0AAJ7DVR2_9HYME|nr:PREDICTED: uncharacterized protein LOC105362456 [Ceratosolen solmsi marchali]
MKFLIILFLFIISYVSVNCDLTDCIEMCEVGAPNEEMKRQCIADCHRVVTCGAHLLKTVEDCIAFCHKKVKPSFIKDCEKGCRFTFDLRKATTKPPNNSKDDPSKERANNSRVGAVH